jgi:hypothetical protein
MSTGHLVRPDGTINTGAKHTPGPWRVNKKVNTSVEQATAPQGMVLICQCEDPDGARLNKEDAANARLIAAAPELLEALDEAFNEITTLNNILYKRNIYDLEISAVRQRELIDRILGAIQKATSHEAN